MTDKRMGTDRLDRPVWESLTSEHYPLSEGGDLARRYLPSINLFASGRDDGPEALSALAALLGSGERAYILQVAAIVVPPQLELEQRAEGVQMVATRSFSAAPREDVVDLGDRDAEEMRALAALTQPGPFLAQTHRMGRFRGIRVGGRLVAMAGERMRFKGFTEVSGVCTHPDFRGRGLARKLSHVVAADIQARGDTPFLHAWKTNRAAIRLYESLGFVVRAEVDVAVVARE